MSKRISVAERLDAAGINEAAERTGSVVEQLLAAPPAGDSALVEIPTERIHNHPRNRKILDDDVADIAAGLKAGEPILNPLGVTAAVDWNAGKPADLSEIPPGDYMITGGGHRRLRAAELAGRKTVPCIVRATFAGGDGRRAALLENVQRKDLDEFEQAEAIAELVTEPYSMSQRDIAKMLGCTQPHVSKRLKLLKLPSTVREKVLLRRLKIADAVELAGVVDTPEIFDRALSKIEDWRWEGKRAVESSTAEYERETAKREAADELKAAGIAVIDRHPAYSLYSKTDPVELRGLGVRPGKHEAEPCHAGWIDSAGKITLACADPKRHLPDGPSKVKASKKALDLLASYGRGGHDDDGEAARQRRQLKKTHEARMTVAANVVRGVRGDVAIDELVKTGLVGGAFHDYNGRKERWLLIRQLVGLVDGDYPTETNTTALVDKVPFAWLQLALAVSFFEGKIRANHVRWGDEQRYYLNFLASEGYEITDVEHDLLGDTRSLAGEWVPPSPEEVKAQQDEDEGPPCRVCGLRAADLEPGVTWVDEDLCSGCADAADAGWLDNDSTAAAQATHDDHEQLLEASEAVG